MKLGYQVGDIMTTTPVMVGMEISLSEAARYMRDSDVNSLLVADGEALKGIFTDEDIVRKTVAEGADPATTTTSSIMEPNVITIHPKEDLYEAILVMRENGIRQLPVVESGKLIGLITLKDILKIEPELFDILIEKYQIRSKTYRNIRKSSSLTDGLCESCGTFSVKLQEVDSKFICTKCVHDIAEDMEI